MPKPKQVKCRKCGKQIERDAAIELSKGLSLRHIYEPMRQAEN